MRPSAARPGLIAVALALLVVLATVPAAGGDGWWGGLDEGEAVSLADVDRGPRDYRDRIITFFCVFHTADAEFKYYPPNTAFSEQRHINFSAWPDGAPMWEERAFKNDLPFLYLRRTNPQRGALVRLAGFTRLEVTGKVRDIVRGRPAIEVFSFRTTGHRLGRTVWKRIMQGRNYARAGTTQGYQLAARAFRDALRPDLPPAYDMQVRKLLADTLRKLGYQEEARAYENGESVGMPKLPEPDATQELPQPPAFPDDMPQPFNAKDGGVRKPSRPSAPNPYGSPDGTAPTGAMPPSAVPPTGPLPPAPLPPRDDAPAMPSGAMPSGALPPSGGDLPGRPANPLTREGDLPGRPGGVRAPRIEQPRAAPDPGSPDGLPPPAPSYRDGRTVEPPSAAKPPVAKPRKAPPGRSGIPPKRRVRLSGVR